jgi:hypothetical protein
MLFITIVIAFAITFVTKIMTNDICSKQQVYKIIFKKFMLNPNYTISFQISCQWKPTKLSKVEGTFIQWKDALRSLLFFKRISMDIICLLNTLGNFLNYFKWM